MKVYYHTKRNVWIPWVIALICGFLLLFLVILFHEKEQNAKAYGGETIAFDSDADFRILEIVPYHGMGEVGYLVGGEEPIDLDGVELNKNYPNDGDLMSILDGIVEWEPYYHHKTKLEEGEYALDYFISTEALAPYYVPEVGTNKITGSGYYERVEDGEGLYQFSGSYEVVENHSGTHNPEVDYFSYSSSQTGDYDLKFSTNSSVDWDGVSIEDSWGQYKVRTIEAVSDHTGDYSAVFSYQTGNVSNDDQCVMFTYEPKTEESDLRVRYRAEIITDTSRFGWNPSKYYKVVDGHYEYAPSGDGTHYVSFVQDDAGDYVGEVIGGVEWSGSKLQLLYQVSYRYTKHSGDYNIAFDHRDSWDTGAIFYVRSDYEIHKGTGSYSFTCKKLNGVEQYTLATNGDYVPTFRAKADNNDRTGADYVWVDCEPSEYVANTKTFGDVGFTLYRENHQRDLIYFYRGSYVNLEAFKKKVIRLEEDIEDYKVDVLSLTPDEVNANISLISQTDFIYIIPTVHNTAYVRWYEKFGKKKSEERILYGDNMDKLPNFYYRYEDVSFTTRVSNDLTWEATYHIFYQIAVENKGIFIDCTVYSSYTNYWTEDIPKPYESGSTAGTSNNVAKLYIMLMQREPIDFYHQFLSEESTENYKIQRTGVSIRDKHTGFHVDTGYFEPPNQSNDTAVYWNQFTFLPELPEGTSDVLTYYESQGIDNPWVSVEKAIVSCHNTTGSFKSDIALNGVLEEERWIDEELLEYIMERDHLSTMPTASSGYDMLNYILRYRFYHSVIYKGSLKILDLEPCMDQTLTVAEVARWCNQQISESNITIVPMTTAEFIGTTEDLCETYDFIYLGASTKQMNTDSANQTVYNDSSLNGKIYLHTGDLIRESPKVGGLLEGDDSQGTPSSLCDARYSGNDITRRKLLELQEYVEQGFPVIVADKFYLRSGENDSINTYYVDNSSYIYQFLNQYLDVGQENVVRKSLVSLRYMSKLLLKPRITIEKRGNATEQTWPEEYEYKDEEGSYPVYLSKIGMEYRLRYRFNLRTTDRFPNLNTQTYDVELRIDYDGDGRFEESEKQGAIEVTQDSVTIPINEDGRYELSLNTNYVLECKVKEGTTGILAYKIIVRQNGADEVCASYIGDTAIKKEQAKEVNVLQIISDDYNEDVTAQANEYLNLEVLSQDSSSLIGKYLDGAIDHHFEFETKKVSEFIDWYRNGPKYDGTLVTSRVSEYDMVIIGGGEHVTEIATEEGIQDLIEYIQNGGACVFLGDTTSPINRTFEDWAERSYPTDEYWGYEVNAHLRNILGMDRYGVTIDSNDGKDQAYQADSNLTQTVAQIQGFTYYSLNQYADQGVASQLRNFEVTTNLAADSPANVATQVNEGRISEYPYQISEKLTIANTHAQYYQLDFEQDIDNDGKSDLIVWYCLSDEENGNGVYSCSPNDVRNNYYIYTLGNVTYSGVGLDAITNPEEAKLFINTLVAAYRVTESDADLEIVEAQEIHQDEFYDYVDARVDQEYADGTGSDYNNENYYKKITFIITDEELSDITVVIKDEANIGYPIYDMYGTLVTGQCAIGMQYCYYVPKNRLNETNTYLFWIHYGTQEATLTLMRRNLFNLQ